MDKKEKKILIGILSFFFIIGILVKDANMAGTLGGLIIGLCLVYILRTPIHSPSLKAGVSLGAN